MGESPTCPTRTNVSRTKSRDGGGAVSRRPRRWWPRGKHAVCLPPAPPRLPRPARPNDVVRAISCRSAPPSLSDKMQHHACPASALHTALPAHSFGQAPMHPIRSLAATRFHSRHHLLFFLSCPRNFSSSCSRHGHYETLHVPKDATKNQIKVRPGEPAEARVVHSCLLGELLQGTPTSRFRAPQRTLILPDHLAQQAVPS